MMMCVFHIISYSLLHIRNDLAFALKPQLGKHFFWCWLLHKLLFTPLPLQLSGVLIPVPVWILNGQDWGSALCWHSFHSLGLSGCFPSCSSLCSPTKSCITTTEEIMCAEGRLSKAALLLTWDTSQTALGLPWAFQHVPLHGNLLKRLILWQREECMKRFLSRVCLDCKESEAVTYVLPLQCVVSCPLNINCGFFSFFSSFSAKVPPNGKALHFHPSVLHFGMQWVS